MTKQVLMPLPSRDFDPTESAVPWKILSSAGVEITFSTPDGAPGICDQRMLHGKGLGPFAGLLGADRNAHSAYQEMSRSKEFQAPIPWSDIDPKNFDGIILPGGHATGMREYLESTVLLACVSKFFDLNKPIGAICHGVLLAARSRNSNNQSVLAGRKTTALLAVQELSAWILTCPWLGSYYRTYEQTVESEVRAALASPKDFLKGPLPLGRDGPGHLSRGFVVRDRNYLSARWPGDAHLFSNVFLEMLNSTFEPGSNRGGVLGASNF